MKDYQWIKSFLQKRKPTDWLILGLVGLMLFVMAIPTGKTTEKVNQMEKDTVEVQLEQMLMGMEGVGKAEVMVTFLDEEAVEGVLVVAQGADSPQVCAQIMEAVMALFEIDAHRIEIVKMTNQEVGN